MAAAKKTATQQEVVSVTLNKTKETKRTVRYDSPEDDSAVGNVYIQQSVFEGGNFPEQITVTITA